MFKDVHEPIIARADFEKVQALVAKTKRREPKKENGKKSVFFDLLYCGDCHKKMHYHTNTKNKDIHYFASSDNTMNHRGACPGRHYIRADTIEQVVTLELRRMAEMLRNDEAAFAEMLAQKTNQELPKERKRDKEELQKAIVRNATVSRLYEKVYEDNISGKISDERFSKMSVAYEAKQKELERAITDCEKKLKEADRAAIDLRMLLPVLREFSMICELTPTIINTLIQRIEIHNNDKSSGHCHVKVDIYFTAVGMIDIPTKQELERLRADYLKRMQSA